MRLPAIFIIAAAIALLTGCTGEQVARAERAVATADETLARTEQAAAVAARALATAQALADRVGSDDAKQAVATARTALEQIQAALPQARLVAEQAHAAMDAAKSAQAAGGSTIDVLIAALGVVVPGLGGAALRLWQTLGKTRTALRIATAHGDAMEAAETDGDAARVKQTTLAAQEAAGVRQLTQRARGKAA